MASTSRRAQTSTSSSSARARVRSEPSPLRLGVPLSCAVSDSSVVGDKGANMTLQDYKARIAAATPLAQLHGSNSNSVPPSMPQTPTRSATSRSHPATPSRSATATPRSLPYANLDVYVRVRPCRAPVVTSHVHEDAKSITVRLESARAGPLGMGRAFTFDHVFDATSQQPEIFDEVAAPLVDAVLDGFNAVCFAYGQTGSGKTYTMHGASTKGDSRGLMVRSVERLLDGIKQRSSAQASYTVSC